MPLKISYVVCTIVHTLSGGQQDMSRARDSLNCGDGWKRISQPALTALSLTAVVCSAFTFHLISFVSFPRHFSSVLSYSHTHLNRLGGAQQHSVADTLELVSYTTWATSWCGEDFRVCGVTEADVKLSQQSKTLSPPTQFLPIPYLW